MAQLKRYAFSFWAKQDFPNNLIVIRGNFNQAREKMVKLLGEKWCFQYEWTPDVIKDLAKYRMFPIPVELAMSLKYSIKPEKIMSIGVLEWKR